MGAGAVISNQSGVTGGQGRLYNKNSWRNEFKKCESLSHTRRMSLNNFEWELTDIKSPQKNTSRSSCALSIIVD